MSTLREWTASEIEEYDDARLELAEDGKIECTRVYIKADADQVIAEKDKEIAELKEECRWRKFSEEKPKHHQYVLVLLNNNGVAECNTELRRWDNGLKFDVEFQDLYLLWQPLPKEPEK